VGVKFGEIDVTQIIENEFRIGVLERLVELLINRMPAVNVTPEELAMIRKEVVKQLQKKYPESGIELKGRE